MNHHHSFQYSIVCLIFLISFSLSRISATSKDQCVPSLRKYLLQIKKFDSGCPIMSIPLKSTTSANMITTSKMMISPESDQIRFCRQQVAMRLASSIIQVQQQCGQTRLSQSLKLMNYAIRRYQRNSKTCRSIFTQTYFKLYQTQLLGVSQFKVIKKQKGEKYQHVSDLYSQQAVQFARLVAPLSSQIREACFPGQGFNNLMDNLYTRCATPTPISKTKTITVAETSTATPVVKQSSDQAIKSGISKSLNGISDTMNDLQKDMQSLEQDLKQGN